VSLFAFDLIELYGLDTPPPPRKEQVVGNDSIRTNRFGNERTSNMNKVSRVGTMATLVVVTGILTQISQFEGAVKSAYCGAFACGASRPTIQAQFDGSMAAPLSHGMIGIGASHNTNVVMSDNYVHGDVSKGIDVSNSENVVVKRNDLSNDK
jgi:hypothetical protein